MTEKKLANLAISSTIEMATAKTELSRIDAMLDGKPLTLIGGLAVQQYVPARRSKDIDLVCDFDTAMDLVGKLYPTNDWQVKNGQGEYRPNFEIQHKVNKLKVYFGPKILERGEYPHVKWAEMGEDTVEFRLEGQTTLRNIRVPKPHYLAYAKIMSFIDRYKVPGKRPKAMADLADFVDLTNGDEFSVMILSVLIRRNMTENIIAQAIKGIVREDHAVRSKLDQSCLAQFKAWWERSSASPPVSKLTRKKKKDKRHVLYISSPHKRISENRHIARALNEAEFSVFVPFNEVAKVCGTGSPEDANAVRNICIDGIIKSDAVVVDVDLYGLDSAWEIGFADGLRKPIIGFNRDISLKMTPRLVNRRRYEDNFMHGWAVQKIYQSFDALLSEHKGKSLYICGPFKSSAIEQLRARQKSANAKIIFPEQYVPTETLPRDYPLQTRANALIQMDACDVMVVMLPRYGMDTSWQIGYSSAKKKTIVGLMSVDDGKEGKNEELWDHWMHGWREKNVFTGKGQLCAGLRGFVEARLI